MKFKRLATILMAAAMMVSLVACTGDNGENVVEETETNHITLAESWGFENYDARCIGKQLRYHILS